VRTAKISERSPGLSVPVSSITVCSAIEPAPINFPAAHLESSADTLLFLVTKACNRKKKKKESSNKSITSLGNSKKHSMIRYGNTPCSA
jgi:hypothetical protein